MMYQRRLSSQIALNRICKFRYGACQNYLILFLIQTDYHTQAYDDGKKSCNHIVEYNHDQDLPGYGMIRNFVMIDSTLYTIIDNYKKINGSMFNLDTSSNDPSIDKES